MRLTPPSARRGDILRVVVRVANQPDGALWLRVTSPDAREYLARSVLIRDGQASLQIPLPLNAARGVWTLDARDAVSGHAGHAAVRVE